MRRLVALAVLVTAVAACTDEHPAPSTTTVVIELDSVPPITAPAPVAAADIAAAEAALLTAADLPAAWTVQPNTDPRTRTDAGDCADSAIGLAMATGDDIVLPDGTIVAQSVSIGDPVVVDDVVGRVDERCIAASARRVVETQIAAVPGTPRSVEIGDVAVSELQVGAPVDGVSAFGAAIPVAIDGLDIVVFVDVVVVTEPGALAMLTARRASLPPNLAGLDDLARAALARLRAPAG